MKKNIIKTLQFAVVVLILVLFVRFLAKDKPVPPQTEKENTEEVIDEEKFVSETEYKNTSYGFSFYLPETWEGFSAIEDEWEGYSLEVTNSSGQVITETGPLISIRHPDWEYKSPRQDIPVMVFSIKQWNDMNADKFNIGAAPINPSELARNKRYVFALPARYNYSYYTGFEEVQELLDKKPLHTF